MPSSYKSPSGSGVSTPQVEEASGYLLLNIEHAVVKQVYEDATMTLARGEFRLECVSLPIPAEIGHQTANPFAPSPADPPVPTHDFWLVIKVGPTFEMPIVPNQEMKPTQDKDGLTYSVPSPHIPNAFVYLTLPLPASQADMEDLESFEVLLRQYRALGAESTALAKITAPIQTSAFNTSTALAPEELRGRIVLINEDNGEMVGQLDQTFDVEEDRKLAGEDKNKPVMLDFGHLREGQEVLRVKVKSVPEEYLDDWLLLGAHRVSKGILSFGSWSSKQMLSGADTFIKHSTPNAEPVKFSPQTKDNFVKVHKGSVKAAVVTKSTIGKITGVVSTVAEKAYTHGYKPAEAAYRRGSNSGFTPPPLPPRSATAHPAGASEAPVPVPYAVRKPTSPAPPVPAKPAHLQPYEGGLRQRNQAGAKGYTVPVPTQTDTMLAESERFNIPPAYSDNFTAEPNSATPGQSPMQSRPQTPSAAPLPKKKLLGRILLAGEVVLTSLEATAHDLINNGTIAASSAAGHKYGADAGEATALVGGSVKNVAVVYIDVAGVGRRAILKSTAKGFVKARLADGETVQLQAEGHGQDIKAGEIEVGKGGEGYVVGMPELGKKEEKSAFSKR
ncbi:uncharacterized protein IL334_003400 [Kwoniella shivajii]|uniref:Senescence domain-containing protein n=1 Tax=Kwoniella shivajii TaxID=564305 RepID=A0ABZ1CXG6_9TREE|nr:hypothetical protein IL334_003400 [Kwoniella shivajii]